MTSSELERLRESKTIVLTTYKRDGSRYRTMHHELIPRGR
jgi:hypothetical protein